MVTPTTPMPARHNAELDVTVPWALIVVTHGSALETLRAKGVVTRGFTVSDVASATCSRPHTAHQFYSLDKWKKVYARTRVTYFKKYFKWDALKPLDTDDHTEIFWPDDYLSEDLMRKLQATSSTYEAKKEKELAYTECKELEFLMIDPIRCRNLKQALSEINKKK
ncbi:hypothetical protein Tco_0851500 [Tanacetum coccineum]